MFESGRCLKQNLHGQSIANSRENLEFFCHSERSEESKK
jgi:hypothetical protein